MTLLVFLNELSYEEIQAPDNTGEALDKLVDVLRAVRRARSDVALITEYPVSQLLVMLNPGWQADGRNRELARFLRGLRNRAPYSSVVTTAYTDPVEYKHRNRAANGLGGAHLVDGLAVSLATGSDWDSPIVWLQRLQMSENEEETVELVEDSVDVRHISELDHIGLHRTWLGTGVLRDIHTGPQLWLVLGDNFPNLRFLPRVEDDLEALNLYWLEPVKNLLYRIDETIERWDDDGGTTGPQWPVKVTPEHENRRQLCWFQDPISARLELFDTHFRFTPGHGRLHFRWDATARQAVIAYIGRKMDT